MKTMHEVISEDENGDIVVAYRGRSKREAKKTKERLRDEYGGDMRMRRLIRDIVYRSYYTNQ